MLEREGSRLVELHVNDGTLGRCQHHVLDELLVLDVAAITADELDACSRERDLPANLP